MTATAQKLDGLDALRGVAALIVLLHHAFGGISLPQNFNTTLLGDVFKEGNLGVNIFFVLSGFVITWSNPKDGRSPRDVLIYVLRRITRIFPMYWVACLTMLPIYWKFAPDSLGEVTPLRVLHDFFLLPFHLTPMLRGAWTLVFEMLFYMLFVPMLWNRRAGLTMWATISAVILGLMATGIEPAHVWLARITSPFVLEFLMGMVVCLWVRKQLLSPRAAVRLIWAGTALMLVFVALECLTPGDWVPANLHYALCASLIVAGLVCLPAPPDGEHSRLFRILQVLGKYSYSIYLFHIPIQQIMLRVAVKTLGTDPGLALVLSVLFAMIAGSLTAGILAGKYLELPMLEWCKKQIARLKPRRPEVTVSAQS